MLAVYLFMALGHWDKRSSINKDLDNNQETWSMCLKNYHLRF